jgi:hypothetical protein
MRLIKDVVEHNFFIRLKSWEYWPFGIVQFPLIMYWIWLSLRARSLLFFTASNPSITMGGMFGESKYAILNQLPSNVLPKTILIDTPVTVDQVLMRMSEANLHFPLIFKPDLGERGYRVKRVDTMQDVEEYLKNCKGSFLAQEFIDLPLECGVFYTRFPREDKGIVTSVVIKEMLTVTGDGNLTVEALIRKNPRAKLQWDRLKIMHHEVLDAILKEGELLELNAIGNHCLGTKFLNGNHLINEQLSEVFDGISKSLDEFYFGRFDLRCESIDDLYQGKVKIMEVNGCGAEPAHIYHPGFSLIEAMKVLFLHWKNIFIISTQNRKRGFLYTPLKDGYRIYKQFQTHTAP